MLAKVKVASARRTASTPRLQESRILQEQIQAAQLPTGDILALPLAAGQGPEGFAEPANSETAVEFQRVEMVVGSVSSERKRLSG